MRYGSMTTAAPADVLARARRQLGGDGAGLRLSSLDLSSVRFESVAGFIRVEVSRLPNGQTEVIVETREHDNEAIEFIRSLPRRGLLARLIAGIRS